MLFNTYIYIFLFLPLTLLVYFALNRMKLTLASKSWLVIMSFVFYGWWNWRYCILMALSIVFNFLMGRMVLKETGSDKRFALLIGIVANLALLGYYKYYNFFILNANQVFGSQLPLNLDIILPIGISFFTFTQIAYLVDAFKGKAKEYSFLNYCLFVTFFPHLLSGPILHHKEMMPQFDRTRNKIFNPKNFAPALALFSVGLFKKVCIADVLAGAANIGFDSSGVLTFSEAWMTSLSYTLQIYFDFSGYTDMALGAALMLNIKLPINFDSPYKALNIGEFWRRWHITLSRFLRDYVYIPLGGNRLREYRIYLNIMATFLVGGLWHGADWSFVLWGFLHGAALIINRLWQKTNIAMPRPLAWFITFNFVNLTWVFFRAKGSDNAVKVLKGMAGLSGVNLPKWLSAKLSFLSGLGITFVNSKATPALGTGGKDFQFIAAVLLIALLAKNSNKMTDDFRPSLKMAFFTAAIAFYAMMNMDRVSQFLYFQF